MEKKMVVEIKFSRKDGKYKVVTKALHNGSHLVEKSQTTGDTATQVFEFANAFIDKHNATNIALTRGLLEDSFAKYLSDTKEQEVKEEQVIEGVSVDAVSEAGQELLADLKAYKLCVEDTIRHQDYESLLFQGILYNYARQELFESEGHLANAYEMTVNIPLEEKEAVQKAGQELRKSELANGVEPFKVERYNRLLVFKKTDYKLTINFI